MSAAPRSGGLGEENMMGRDRGPAMSRMRVWRPRTSGRRPVDQLRLASQSQTAGGIIF